MNGIKQIITNEYIEINIPIVDSLTFLFMAIGAKNALTIE